MVVDTNAFAMERSIGRVYGNVWTVDLISGARTDASSASKIARLQSSPGGRYSCISRTIITGPWTSRPAGTTNMTATIATSFVDRESDATVAQKPAFGVAGWTTGDQTVLLYDKLDIWEVKPDGTGATRLTNGAAEGQIRHRFVRLDPDAEWIDRTQPLSCRSSGLRSKKSGYARDQRGSRQRRR